MRPVYRRPPAARSSAAPRPRRNGHGPAEHLTERGLPRCRRAAGRPWGVGVGIGPGSGHRVPGHHQLRRPDDCPVAVDTDHRVCRHFSRSRRADAQTPPVRQEEQAIVCPSRALYQRSACGLGGIAAFTSAPPDTTRPTMDVNTGDPSAYATTTLSCNGVQLSDRAFSSRHRPPGYPRGGGQSSARGSARMISSTTSARSRLAPKGIGPSESGPVRCIGSTVRGRSVSAISQSRPTGIGAS